MTMQTTTGDMSQVLLSVYTEVERRFQQVNDPAHGWEHVRRVYSLAEYLAEREGANRFIVGMAALMHDIGRLEHDEAAHHADLSVKSAAQLMNEYGLAPEIQDAVLHAIEAHSFSRNIEPRTIEARVVRDADRLDGLGAIGIMRWAITGTIRRTPETLSYNPTDPFAQQHTPDDKRYMLDHFYSKLLKLEDSMSTETGRKLARQRTAFMRLYLDEFKRELEIQAQ